MQCTIASHMNPHTQHPAPGGVREVLRCQTCKGLATRFRGRARTASTPLSAPLVKPNKGFQAIAAEISAYSKKAFEDGTRAFEQLLGAKSFEQAIEIQSQYAKKAFDTYVAELSKLSEMYVGLTRNAYKPVEQAAAKAGVANRLRSA